MEQQVPARQRISVFAAELQPGDVLRDRGVDRTVRSVEESVDVVALVLVHFEPHPERPDVSKLGCSSAYPVTAWRPAVG